MINPINNFIVVDTVYGKWIVNRFAQYHAETFIKTGHPIDQDLTEIVLSIARSLPENCIAVDAGANTGVMTIPLAHALKNKNGKVYSFEVQKKLFYALCGTVVLNNYDNVSVYNCGLGSMEMSLRIEDIDYTKPQDFGIISLVDQEKIAKSNHSFVDIIPLDILELERLDFLKLDVEGMEIDILNGSIHTIKKHRPWAYIEFWNVGKEAILNWFADMDYSFIQIKGADVVCCPNEKLKDSGLNFNGTKW
jgi:FkbM family methyltransferase